MPVHCRVILSIRFSGIHIYTWVERGTVRVKCLAQEHNKVSPASTQTRIAQSGVERTNHEATPPVIQTSKGDKIWFENWEIQEIWIKVAVFDSLVREGKQHLVQVIERFKKSRVWEIRIPLYVILKYTQNYLFSEKDTICSRKHDTSSYHFTQYAPNRPHINVFTVTHAQNNFRGSVVPRHNIRSHHECCTSRSRKAKVKDLLNVKYTNKCYNQLHYLARVSQISLVAGFHARRLSWLNWNLERWFL